MRKLSKIEAKRLGRLGGLAAARNKPKEILAARATKAGIANRTLHGAAFFSFIGRLPKLKSKRKS